jgi:hypothetical protein
VRDIFKALNLRQRRGRTGQLGGMFRYMDPHSGKEIEFHWDGAGIDRNGFITLLEEETGIIPSLHVYGHLSRLVIMISRGEQINRLVWIIHPSELGDIKEKVESWIHFFAPICNLSFPAIEYWTPEGKQIVQMEATPCQS